MHKLIKLLLPSLFFIIFILLASPVSAACFPNDPAICDAPAGECSTTCNGGLNCIVSAGVDNCEEIIRLRECTEFEASQTYPEACPPKEETFTDCTGTACTETWWPTCCSAGTPSVCGDGTCDTAGGETPTSCVSDCGDSTWCGDGSCNGSENSTSCLSDCPVAPFCGDGACNNGEDCNTCSADCTCGAFCGDGSCNGTDTCSNCSADCGACAFCGDGSCNNGETCSSCASDCGSCAGSFCGDFICNGFETCSTCAGDCGSCASNEAWFQISGGHLGSENITNLSLALQSNITGDEACVAPACIRSLMMEDLLSTDFSDGFAIIGSGTIDANSLISERTENTYALDTKKTRYKEKYEFFYRNSGLGLSPTNDFTGTETDALKPTYNAADFVYHHSGDITIQTPWSVASGETYVIFIDGNLTLTDGNGSNDQLIGVAEGGFLAFIVSGNITVEESLGNSTLTDTTANVEGVFVADGTLTIESRGEVGGGDDRFIGEGVFAGWSGVSLNRNFADGAGRSSENNDKAAELFVYRPDLLKNMPSIMQVPIRIWQETN